ncbi:MAG: type II secretion system protein [Deltaproteobacteria bacterium]|nr:type II secretion system protein [Deltaproteobacteria bacterium]
MQREKGFTLIELVLVIAVLGVLAVSALPNLFDISLTNARNNARDGVVGAVQAGLSLYGANQISQGNTESYPTLLETSDLADGTASSRTNPLFNNILQGGVTRDWTKKNDTCYTYTGGGATDDYQYTAGTTGTFVFASGGC